MVNNAMHASVLIAMLRGLFAHLCPSDLAGSAIPPTIMVVAVAALVVTPVAATIITAWPVVPVIPAPIMTIPVTGRIFALVPVVANEENALAAGVVPAAIAAPVVRVALGDMQVDWRTIDFDALDHPRLPVDQLRRRIVANIDTPEKAGLTNAHRNAYVG